MSLAPAVLLMTAGFVAHKKSYTAWIPGYLIVGSPHTFRSGDLDGSAQLADNNPFLGRSPGYFQNTDNDVT